jgi:hypothetical protein
MNEQQTMNPDDKLVYLGYTRNQLEAAFKKVQNKTHWKNPISAIISEGDVNVVGAAIDFYTGGGAEFSTHSKGVRVTAPGYYAIIGA